MLEELPNRNWGITTSVNRAIADYSKAIQLKPDFILAYRNRAGAYEKMGDRARAKADRDKVAELEKQKSQPEN
jgi:tetratricopeptide (TPR) repeat protein